MQSCDIVQSVKSVYKPFCVVFKCFVKAGIMQHRWEMNEGICYIGGVILTGESQVPWGDVSLCHLLHHKSHMDGLNRGLRYQGPTINGPKTVQRSTRGLLSSERMLEVCLYPTTQHSILETAISVCAWRFTSFSKVLVHNHSRIWRYVTTLRFP